MNDNPTPEILLERFPDLVFTRVEGVASWVGTDGDGEVQVSASGPVSQADPIEVAQDAMETGSQVVGADDEWA